MSLRHCRRILLVLYNNNMAEQGEKSDDRIKVTVKTPRDKKDVHVEGNGSIRQVKFVVCESM